MPVKTRHRFSVDDYYRMAETGILPPDARVELLEGEIIDMSPIGPFHGGVVKFLITLFTQRAGGRWTLSVQDPLHLDDHSEPQPDLMLLKPASHGYKTRHPNPQDVYLLIEVADSTLDTDRGLKIPAYARAGILESWLINLVEQTIEIYRQPSPNGYPPATILRAGQQAHPKAFPDSTVDIDALFSR